LPKTGRHELARFATCCENSSTTVGLRASRSPTMIWRDTASYASPRGPAASSVNRSDSADAAADPPPAQEKPVQPAYGRRCRWRRRPVHLAWRSIRLGLTCACVSAHRLRGGGVRGRRRSGSCQVRPGGQCPHAPKVVVRGSVRLRTHLCETLEHHESIARPATQALRSREQIQERRLVLGPRLHRTPGKVMERLVVLRCLVRIPGGKRAAFLAIEAVRANPES
jgi:hypothetical protein